MVVCGEVLPVNFDTFQGGAMGDLRAIACNVAVASPGVSVGALAYIVQLSGDRAKVRVRSRSGRWIERWLPFTALANFRFKTIPPSHSQFDRITPVGAPEYFTDADLAILAARGSGQGLTLR